MLNTRKIHPLTDFLRNHKVHVASIKETKMPEVLTVNGHAEIVMLDADSYHDLLTMYSTGRRPSSRGFSIPGT